MKNLSAQNQAVILGIISVTAFAMTLPFSKIAVTHLSGIQVGLLRSLLAGIVAIPILYFTKSAFPNRSQTMRLFLASLGIIYGFPILSAMGMQHAPVGHGAVVLALNLPIVLCASLFIVDFNRLNWLIMQGSFTEIGAILFLAWVSSLLGFFSWNKALAMGGIAKISQLQFLQTFITYAIAVLFMNEKLDVMAILAGMITVLIVFYTQKIARKG